LKEICTRNTANSTLPFTERTVLIKQISNG